jgi:hypothetical protein
MSMFGHDDGPPTEHGDMYETQSYFLECRHGGYHARLDLRGRRERAERKRGAGKQP